MTTLVGVAQCCGLGKYVTSHLSEFLFFLFLVLTRDGSAVLLCWFSKSDVEIVVSCLCNHIVAFSFSAKEVVFTRRLSVS